MIANEIEKWVKINWNKTQSKYIKVWTYSINLSSNLSFTFYSIMIPEYKKPNDYQDAWYISPTVVTNLLDATSVYNKH